MSKNVILTVEKFGPLFASYWQHKGGRGGHPEAVVPIVLGMILIAVVIIWISSIANESRRKGREDWAKSKGYNFDSDPDENLVFGTGTELPSALWAQICDLKPFSNHRSSARNIVSGKCEGVPFTLFDYVYRVGKHTHTYSVVVLTTPVFLPSFEIRPRSFWDSFGFSSYSDSVDLEGNTYLSINAADTSRVKAALTKKALDAIASSGFERWTGAQKSLLVLESGRRSESEFEDMLSAGVKVVRAIGA